MSHKRSIWKVPFSDINQKLIYNKDRDKNFNFYVIRSSIITPYFINKSVKIYNGRHYIDVLISEKHVGLKFGEIVMTKVVAKRKINKKKNLKRIVKRK